MDLCARHDQLEGATHFSPRCDFPGAAAHLPPRAPKRREGIHGSLTPEAQTHLDTIWPGDISLPIFFSSFVPCSVLFFVQQESVDVFNFVSVSSSRSAPSDFSLTLL